MHKIEHNLTQVNTRIQQAAATANRNNDTITLLAVSKKKPETLIQAAYHAGQRDFGENYLQEALDKIRNIKAEDIRWHFIGPIQSNKTRAIAEHFHWVHTVERLKIAQRLSDQRPDNLPPLNICLQVNIDNEETKSGVSAEEVEELAVAVSQLPKINLRGLMAIPAKIVENNSQHSPFERMQELFKRLKKKPQLANMDTLSMGMSDDLEAAIQADATIVRVGTAIFGQRL